jgi:SPP1 gp7 family putative phage head morphogenesis protein
VFNVSIGNLTRAELKAIVRMPIEGLPLGDWWLKQTRDMTLATRQQMQLGMVAGEGPDKIAGRIVPRGSAPAVFRRARNNANILIRTSLTTVQNTAAFEAYQTAGEQVTDKYMYVSAKDNRVTEICRALDGRTFAYKDPQAKRPPQHIRCRSTIVPVVNFAKIGLPVPDPKGPLGFRSYSDWLRTQTKTEQDAILGPARADMWRDGKASLEAMVTTDNRVLTLKQLRDVIGDVAPE